MGPLSRRLPAVLPCVLLATLLGATPRQARACGCFAPPDPASPVVQSGENILFSVEGGQVTAHIQIQYQGSAQDFGWLLPLPSLPTLELGSDEVFSALARTTRPLFRQDVVYPARCDWNVVPDFAKEARFNPDFGLSGGGGGGGGDEPDSPLVVAGGVGPYDYAVLKADARQPMLDWLAKNRFFVPAGTADVVGPYIHPGAYFLALKLHPGQSAGDIQPVVVRYASDLPMIPIVLTSVTASPNLGVWVWVLGPGRAVPRNYHHVVLDDARLDWSIGPGSGGLPPNYEEGVSAAVKSAPGRHAFVTELATSAPSVGRSTFPPDRFGDLATLRTWNRVPAYLSALRGNQFTFDATLVSILQKYISVPPTLRDGRGQPVSPANYYYNFDFWLQSRPQAFTGVSLTLDPAPLTDEIEARIVKPVRAVAALFAKAKTVTRLHTYLAPADMTADPVFSFNPSLPEVVGERVARREMRCGNLPYTWESALTTPRGFVVDSTRKLPALLPWAERIEVLRDSGPPEVVTDNAPLIRALLGPSGAGGEGVVTLTVGGGGCAVGGEEGPGEGGWRAAGAVAGWIPAGLLVLWVLRRRRQGTA